MKEATTLATMRSRGMQICHLEGFFQKSWFFAGDQLGGGVSGSDEESSRRPIPRPISDRLPLMVSRRDIGSEFCVDVRMDGGAVDRRYA